MAYRAKRLDGDTRPDRATIARWVTEAARGDRGSWQALVDCFGRLVWSVALSSGLRPADAADVSQIVWLRLVENMDRIRDPGSVGAWLATIARRESLRVLRFASRESATDNSVIDLRDETTCDVIADMLGAERSEAMQKAFVRLPPRSQMILTLLLGDVPLTYLELSEVMQMPVGSIGPTRARCLAQLRSQLKATGVALEDIAG